MILLSAVEIFVATFPVGPQMAAVLDWINNITLWFFVVEVTLRIWAAPEQSPRFRGVCGRLRYCLTFYGFIDFISTYPFLIQFFVPLPIGILKVLRTARMIRILRITRYAKSFNLLTNSIREKRNELIVSTQFLLIITFILSLMLHFYEHDAQPEAYGNGFSSAIWAFAQYIGGFNFISREYGATAPYQSFYVVKEELAENQSEFNTDLEQLMNRPGAWSFTMLAASGANEPEYPTQVHLGFGAAKGDETLDAPSVMVSDKERAAALRDELTATLRDSLQLSTDSGRYHSTAAANLWSRRLDVPADSNHVVVRIAWSAMLWSGNRLLLAKTIADTINRVVLERPTPSDPTLTVKAISFD